MRFRQFKLNYSHDDKKRTLSFIYWSADRSDTCGVIKSDPYPGWEYRTDSNKSNFKLELIL
jgi:hypothetical protein